MSVPTSWRELLKSIISDSTERNRIAAEMRIHPITLTRWSRGTSKPLARHIQQMVRAIPKQYQTAFIDLLKQEHIEYHPQDIDELSDEIEYAFIRQLSEMRAMTPENLLFWTFCRKVLQHALRRLDPYRRGMSITIAQCQGPENASSIRCLREIMGLGTFPWPDDLEQDAMLLGAESLAGQAVMGLRPIAIDDLTAETRWRPARHVEYEISAIAHPILYTNRTAGCLLVSSTQPNYFQHPIRRLLIGDYAQLIAQAFIPKQFYAQEQINLHMMPPGAVQRAAVVTFQQRVRYLLKTSFATSHPLTRDKASQIVWEQIAEELMQHELLPGTILTRV